MKMERIIPIFTNTFRATVFLQAGYRERCQACFIQSGADGSFLTCRSWGGVIWGGEFQLRRMALRDGSKDLSKIMRE